jgi:hypothetical protein
MSGFLDHEAQGRGIPVGLAALGAGAGVLGGLETVMKLVSTLTCPLCGHQAAETMPTDARQS